jgi:hypothetical protein
MQYKGGETIFRNPNDLENASKQFWKDYSVGVAENMRKAVLAKGKWVSDGKCTGKYALACADSLWKAAYAFVEALNNINNHDTIAHCCKHQGNGDDTDGDSSGITLAMYARALMLAGDLASVDPVTVTDTHAAADQDPTVEPQED